MIGNLLQAGGAELLFILQTDVVTPVFELRAKVFFKLLWNLPGIAPHITNNRA
jgi:hypothetical protein